MGFIRKFLKRSWRSYYSIRITQEALSSLRTGHAEINGMCMKSWPRKGKALSVYL